MKHGQPISSYPEALGPKKTFSSSRQKVQLFTLDTRQFSDGIHGRSRLEKRSGGGGFLNTQKYVNIYIYILTFQWKPYVHVSCLFPIWTFVLMWHRCHLYGWCLSDSWSSELKCLHFDHLHPTPVAQTRFSSRQPKITVAPARAKAYEKGTKTSMTRSGMLRMSFSVPFWDLAIHVFLVVP